MGHGRGQKRQDPWGPAEDVDRALDYLGRKAETGTPEEKKKVLEFALQIISLMDSDWLQRVLQLVRLATALILEKHVEEGDASQLVRVSWLNQRRPLILVEVPNELFARLILGNELPPIYRQIAHLVRRADGPDVRFRVNTCNMEARSGSRRRRKKKRKKRKSPPKGS